MKCPFCDKEMELGFIQCRDGVTWSPKMSIISAFSSLTKGSQPIENGAAEDFRAVYAYRCKDCAKIIIDFSKDKK